jgi:hypothetical protein
MRALLVYPEFPDTYWSFRHALTFEGKRAAFPPLGLLTISVSNNQSDSTLKTATLYANF